MRLLLLSAGDPNSTCSPTVSIGKPRFNHVCSPGCSFSNFSIFPRFTRLFPCVLPCWIAWNSSFCRKTPIWPLPKIIFEMKFNGKSKIKICKKMQMRARKFRNNERISNLVTESRLGSIWPLLGKKRLKTGYIFPISLVFDIFWPKSDQINPTWILRLDLESSYQFVTLNPPFVMICAFWFFDLPYHFIKKKIFGRGEVDVFRQKELFHVIQHGKTHENHRRSLEKW